MKWAHPLKGRTIKQAMADALDEKLPEKSFCDDGFSRNSPMEILFEGVCSWTHSAYHTWQWNIHSWDTMQDCLKYGFDVCDDGCVVARDNDWNHKKGDTS